MIALLALLLGWNPNAPLGPAPVMGPDGGAVAVYLINPPATDGGGVAVTNFPNYLTDVQLRADYLALRPLAAYGPDAGDTVDVTGSTVNVLPHAVFIVSPALNPFLPRCNPVRRARCQP